ncbi:hypothetical protein BCD67_25100 [Oscillatoriales cyanobacterium USR001]|nr:hypothetical protein BCD67_25100 [Oscillatoriales cyanobacterium USR001]
MSGGLFDWVGEMVNEISSEIAEAFGFDDATGSNSEATQGRTSSKNQERGTASYLQGKDLERYTEQQLDEFGLNAFWDEGNLVYDETLEQYGKNTQIDVIIRDSNDNEVAIMECKAYTSKWNNADAVDQAKRLVYLANERGIPLIFSTSDGTADCFGSGVKEVLNKTQWFVISPDNIFFADSSDVKENGLTLGLPPELQSHWHSNSSNSGGESLSIDGGGEVLLGGLISSFVGFFGSSSDSKSSGNSDDSSSNAGDSGSSWLGDWFGSNSDSELSDSSDSNSSDSGDSGGSWDLFGGSSDSESNNNYDYSSGDSNSSYSSDSDSSYSSHSDSSYSYDSGSSDYADSSGSDSSSSSNDSSW